MILYLPNETSVHAELDQFFGPFKGGCRYKIFDHFSEKLENKIVDIRDNMRINNTIIKSNSIDLMKILNTKLISTVRNNPEFGDQHETVDEELTRMKCVVGL